MFTGIVQELGTVERLAAARDADRLTVRAPRLAPSLTPGESVAVNGVCLTVVESNRGVLLFEIVPETRRLTALGAIKAGDRVNLERSLALSDRLNGHIVLGHVDGIGMVTQRRVARGECVLAVKLPNTLRPYVVPKGPIALDGVSLTVGADIVRDVVRVFLIPETLKRTTLGWREPGDHVNIEVDYVAKLVLKASGRGSVW